MGSQGSDALEPTKGETFNLETPRSYLSPSLDARFPGRAERERATPLLVEQREAGLLLHRQGQCDEPGSRGLAYVKPACFRQTWHYPPWVGNCCPPGPAVVTTLGSLRTQIAPQPSVFSASAYQFLSIFGVMAFFCERDLVSVVIIILFFLREEQLGFLQVGLDFDSLLNLFFSVTHRIHSF